MTQSFEDVVHVINTLRRNSGHVTNLFLTPSRLQNLLDSPSTLVRTSDRFLTITVREEAVHRCYFLARSLEDLSNLATDVCTCHGPVVLDVVGRYPHANVISEYLVHNGFERHSTFLRLVARPYTVPSPKGGEGVRVAVDSDLPTVVALIETEFDPLNAHIPSREEIAAAISRGEIFVVDEGNGLEGLAFFHVVGPLEVVLRYLVVAAASRGRGIGSRLLTYAQQVHPRDVRTTLWVGTYNSALVLYKRMGFIADGVEDHVLVVGGRVNNAGFDTDVSGRAASRNGLSIE